MKADLSLPSPAKLNLFLHITGRRANGYHDLQTLFQLLDYGDTLHFTARPDHQIILECNRTSLATEDNLIYRAVRMLQDYCGLQSGIQIYCQKVLPIGGGLGGGSSNAATTILALNKLWDLQLSPAKMAELGQQLGADVPVFIHGQTAWAEGIGERLTPVEMPPNWYLVIAPNCTVSTAAIFRHPDLTRDTHPIKIRAFLDQGGHNDCQPIAEKLFPEVQEVRQWLERFSTAKMTGTGACVFSQFESRQQCEQVYRSVPSHWHCFMAQGLNKSPALRALIAE